MIIRRYAVLVGKDRVRDVAQYEVFNTLTEALEKSDKNNDVFEVVGKTIGTTKISLRKPSGCVVRLNGEIKGYSNEQND